jgi:hypothetical protein
MSRRPKSYHDLAAWDRCRWDWAIVVIMDLKYMPIPAMDRVHFDVLMQVWPPLKTYRSVLSAVRFIQLLDEGILYSGVLSRRARPPLFSQLLECQCTLPNFCYSAFASRIPALDTLQVYKAVKYAPVNYAFRFSGPVTALRAGARAKSKIDCLAPLSKLLIITRRNFSK